ncbi:hypothetical protein ES703_31441 [subsurface metagenome]
MVETAETQQSLLITTMALKAAAEMPEIAQVTVWAAVSTAMVEAAQSLRIALSVTTSLRRVPEEPVVKEV